MSFDNDVDVLLAQKWKYESAGYDPETARQMAIADVQHQASNDIQTYHASYSDDEIESLGGFPQEDYTEDRLLDADESLSELYAITATCNAHGIGMDDLSYRVATIAYKSAVAGTANFKPTFPTLESVHAHMVSPEMLMMKFEAGIKETMKDYWNKTKNFFVNLWNKMKMWYVKAWSGCRRLGNRAVAVRKASEAKTGTIKNSTFDFGGATYLHVGGKMPEPGLMVQLVKNLSSVGDVLFGKTASSYNNVCDRLSKLAEELAADASKIKQEDAGNSQQANQPATPQGGTTTPTTTGNSQGQQATTGQNTNKPKDDDFKFDGDKNGLVEEIKSQLSQISATYKSLDLKDWDVGEWSKIKAFSSYAGSEGQPPKTKLKKTDIQLPGGKMVVVASYDDGNTNLTTTNQIKDLAFCFGGMVTDWEGKAKDVSDTMTAKTLSVNQIQDICDTVIDSCKIGLDYEKLFVERDKMFNNLGKALENAINSADKLEGKALAFVKANTNAIVNVWNKINKFDGAYFKYSFGVYSKAVDYCQQSLNQIDG